MLRLITNDNKTNVIKADYKIIDRTFLFQVYTSVWVLSYATAI